MHACGHNMHMTALLAAIQMMVENREKWNGILIVLFQLAEESAEGVKGNGRQRFKGARP
jgi:metal-dependent amidase/aminoacylase/carboxypeptidase family protein